MYDQLLEEDPHIRSIVAKAEAREIANFQNTLLSVIETRFPTLAENVAHKIVLPDSTKALNLLIVQVASASDEKAARRVLGIPAAE
jgi:hypothetical protein